MHSIKKYQTGAIIDGLSSSAQNSVTKIGFNFGSPELNTSSVKSNLGKGWAKQAKQLNAQKAAQVKGNLGKDMLKSAGFAALETGLNMLDSKLIDKTNVTSTAAQNWQKYGSLAMSGAGTALQAANVINGNPAGGAAIAAGKLAGNLIGGRKDRAYGYGSMGVDLVSQGLAFAGPIGIAAATALQLINGAGIGQKRAIKVKDFSSEYANPYAATAAQSAKRIAKYSNKKAGTFDFGFRHKGNKRLRDTLDKQGRALINVETGKNMSLAMNSDIRNATNSYIYSGTQPQLSAKRGIKFPELDEIREIVSSWEVKKFQNGGVIEKNVIPTGALHKNKHHIEEVRPELEGQITEKGIPVVSSDIAENVTQFAEVEAGEITFAKTVTEQIEEFYKQYKEEESDELAIELGKFLVEQILHNTIDKDKIIKKT